jgi:CheY-like chemotaxis protein
VNLPNGAAAIDDGAQSNETPTPTLKAADEAKTELGADADITSDLDAVEQRAGEAQLIKVTVTDTGPGLTSEQCDRLFKPFQQAEASTNRKFGGTGLGLHISRRIVENMNGCIWVESEVGEGSSFSIIVELNQLPLDVDGIVDAAAEAVDRAAFGDAPPPLLPSPRGVGGGNGNSPQGKVLTLADIHAERAERSRPSTARVLLIVPNAVVRSAVATRLRPMCASLVVADSRTAAVQLFSADPAAFGVVLVCSFTEPPDAAAAEVAHLAERAAHNAGSKHSALRPMVLAGAARLVAELRSVCTAAGKPLPKFALLHSLQAATEAREELATAGFHALFKNPTPYDKLSAFLRKATTADLKPFGSSKTACNEKMSRLATLLPASILIAEDNHVNTKVALKMFDWLGYAPHHGVGDWNHTLLSADSRQITLDGPVTFHAADGQVVVDFFTAGNHVDLVYMDIQMPRLDGLSAALEVGKIYATLPRLNGAAIDEWFDKLPAAERTQNPLVLFKRLCSEQRFSNRRPVIVALSAEVERRVEMRHVGILQLISKPFKLQALRGSIQQLLSDQLERDGPFIAHLRTRIAALAAAASASK